MIPSLVFPINSFGIPLIWVNCLPSFGVLQYGSSLLICFFIFGGHDGSEFYFFGKGLGSHSDKAWEYSFLYFASVDGVIEGHWYYAGCL